MSAEELQRLENFRRTGSQALRMWREYAMECQTGEHGMKFRRELRERALRKTQRALVEIDFEDTPE